MAERNVWSVQSGYQRGCAMVLWGCRSCLLFADGCGLLLRAASCCYCRNESDRDGWLASSVCSAESPGPSPEAQLRRFPTAVVARRRSWTSFAHQARTPPNGRRRGHARRSDGTTAASRRTRCAQRARSRTPRPSPAGRRASRDRRAPRARPSADDRHAGRANRAVATGQPVGRRRAARSLRPRSPRRRRCRLTPNGRRRDRGASRCTAATTRASSAERKTPSRTFEYSGSTGRPATRAESIRRSSVARVAPRAAHGSVRSTLLRTAVSRSWRAENATMSDTMTDARGDGRRHPSDHDAFPDTSTTEFAEPKSSSAARGAAGSAVTSPSTTNAYTWRPGGRRNETIHVPRRRIAREWRRDRIPFVEAADERDARRVRGRELEPHDLALRGRRESTRVWSSCALRCPERLTRSAPACWLAT